MSDIDSRQHKRYRVHLAVRFETASDFVSQYAENLSHGGVFVRGAHHLEQDQTVPIELDLPGVGKFSVQARVAFILSEEVAGCSGRTPGAGLEIVHRPDGFEAALSEYLLCLGRRREHVVYADSAMIRAALEGAGYRARILPAPASLILELARSNLPVIGIVISKQGAAAYEHLPAAVERFRIYETTNDFDRILSELDHSHTQP